jgi:hypothetical protein
MKKIFPDGIRIWFFHLLVAMIPFVLNAQKDVQLFEKEKNGNIIIYAKNLSKTDLKIDLRIESSGLNLSNSISHKQVLKGGSTEEVITLTPTPGLAWSYKTSLSYSPVNDDGTWNETKVASKKIKALPRHEVLCCIPNPVADDANKQGIISQMKVSLTKKWIFHAEQMIPMPCGVPCAHRALPENP